MLPASDCPTRCMQLEIELKKRKQQQQLQQN